MTVANPGRVAYGPFCCYPSPDRVPVSAEKGYEIHEFLAQEALLLDRQQYTDWGTLLAQDSIYRCSKRLFAAFTGRGMETIEDAEREYDRAFLLRYLQSPNTSVEDLPLQPVRRLITNVIVSAADNAREFAVTSYVLVAGARGALAQQPSLTIERRDVLRRHAYTYRIVRRSVDVSATDGDVLRAARIF